MVVLWILAFLVLLGMGLGYSTSIDQRLVSYQRDRTTAVYLAKAGYYRALAELEKDKTPQVDSFLDTWANNPEIFGAVDLGAGSFSVGYSVRDPDGLERTMYGIMDEDRKVDLNTASQAVLLRLPAMTNGIADAVLDWRAEQQKVMERLGKVEDKPFRSVEDLLLLDGVTPEAFRLLQPLVTVYTDGKVNLNSAPREVLVALGMDESLVNKILRYRLGPDGVQGSGDDQEFQNLGGAEQQLNAFEALTPKESAQITNLVAQNRIKVSSKVFRIQATGAAGDGKVKHTVVAVVERTHGAEGVLPPLAWYEN